MIGVSKYTLYNYEHYKTIPDNEVIKRIMEAYNVSYNEIRFQPNNKKKLAVKNEM